MERRQIGWSDALVARFAFSSDRGGNRILPAADRRVRIAIQAPPVAGFAECRDGEDDAFPWHAVVGALVQPPPPIDPDDALAIDVSFFAVERMPPGIASLDSRARLIISTHGAAPVRSTGMLTRLAGYASDPTAEMFVPVLSSDANAKTADVGHAVGALPDGATARFEITDSEKTGAAPHRHRTSAISGATIPA